MMISRILVCFFLLTFALDAAGKEPKRAIVIGASAGMGKELSKLLASDGYIVGMAARRVHLLKEIQNDIPTQTYSMQMDASEPFESVSKLEQMIIEMGGLDLLIGLNH